MALSALNDSIYLSEINLSGTHDSATAFVSWEKMSRCQSLTIKEQLALGIRLFDIRLYRRGKNFFLVHGIANCYTDEKKEKLLCFDEVLGEFKSFLKENPKETVVVSIKQDRGIREKKFTSSFHKKYIIHDTDLWYLENENPRLSQCRGKMVLMRRCKVKKRYLNSHKLGLDFSGWEDQGSAKSFDTEVLRLSQRLSAGIQDRYTLDCHNKWYSCALPFLKSCKVSETEFALHFISTAFRKKGDTLYETAAEMNRYFKTYELKKGNGWFFLDFPDMDIIEKINSSNKE